MAWDIGGLAMRYVVSVLAVMLFIATGMTTPVSGQEITAVKTVSDAAEILRRAETTKLTVCLEPRSGTTDECLKAYEEWEPKYLDFVARQILYVQAQKVGKKDPQLERQWQQSKTAAVSAFEQIERRYYPTKVPERK